MQSVFTLGGKAANLLFLALLAAPANLVENVVRDLELEYGDGDGEIKKDHAVDRVVADLTAIVPDLPFVDEEAAIRGAVGGLVESAVEKMNALLKRNQPTS